MVHGTCVEPSQPATAAARAPSLSLPPGRLVGGYHGCSIAAVSPLDTRPNVADGLGAGACVPLLRRHDAEGASLGERERARAHTRREKAFCCQQQQQQKVNSTLLVGAYYMPFHPLAPCLAPLFFFLGTVFPCSSPPFPPILAPFLPSLWSKRLG
jgi:hypothetical protein